MGILHKRPNSATRTVKSFKYIQSGLLPFPRRRVVRADVVAWFYDGGTNAQSITSHQAFTLDTKNVMDIAFQNTAFRRQHCNTHLVSLTRPTGQDVELTVPALLRPPSRCDSLGRCDTQRHNRYAHLLTITADTINITNMHPKTVHHHYTAHYSASA